MEWYWTLTIILGFLGIVVGFFFLIKKNIVDKNIMTVLRTMLDSISSMVDSWKSVTKNDHTIDVMSKVIELLRSGVYAAENLYYNGEISKDERKAECLRIFKSLLEASNIELPASIEGVLDSLIAAICEEMGHGQKPKADTE